MSVQAPLRADLWQVRNRPASRHTRAGRLRATAFVMPAFVLHAAIVGVPALSLLYYSFTNWSGVGEPIFNGLTNFQQMLVDQNFHAAILNNLVYMAVFLTAPIIAGLFMAFLTMRAGRLQMVYRAIFFVPFVVSPVITGAIFSIYYDPTVGIDGFFRSIGWTALANIHFLGDPHLALFSVAAADYWHWWGFVMVIFLAAFHQVDKGLYEAAALDGASRLQQFIHVTLPQLRPTLVTLMMITVIGSFLTFDYVWVMTQGGPAGATELASTWIYKQAFTMFNAGYGSMLSLIICGACVVIYFMFRAVQKRWDV